jgi:hypothetical protein
MHWLELWLGSEHLPRQPWWRCLMAPRRHPQNRFPIETYLEKCVPSRRDFLHRHWPDGLICGRELSSRPGMDGTREIA